jgi:ankyrin repeat protein
VKDRQDVSARDLAGYRDNNSIKALFARVRSPHRLEGDSAEKLALLRRQVDAQGNLYHGWPLLAAAVAQRDDRTARDLLAGGSDPWVTTPNNTNAIAIAINNGDESLASLMMHNQPIRTPEQEKESLRLLAMTASTDRLSVLKDLIAMIPAEGNVHLPVEETALWTAIDSGHEDAAMTLASWQGLDDRTDDRGRNLLLLASERGLSNVVRKLLGQGLDVGTADNAGRTSTWYAAENGHCRLMLMLTDHNADIDQSDLDGHTPLIRAVVAEHDECVAVAIAARSNVDHQTRTGNTALIMAARDRPQSLRLLLDADADMSIRNEASFTALMTAVRERCVECVSYLIRAGANPRRQNSQGQNCYDIAAGDERILAILES